MSINCKQYADEILDGIKDRVNHGQSHGHLVVITIGDDPASESYVKGKQKDCLRVGFKFTQYKYPAETKTHEIVTRINELRKSGRDITGLIVQLPVPPHIEMDKIMAVIPRNWDVDGFLPKSLFKPCTPEGVVYIMKRELGENLSGKTAIIAGRGKLVGAPLREMLLDENMTVIQCHSHTPKWKLYELMDRSDVFVSAIGHPNYFMAYSEKDNYNAETIVIDCGVNRDGNGKLCGDVENLGYDRQTPVPGGVGLMTRAMLIKHCEWLYRKEDKTNVQCDLG